MNLEILLSYARIIVAESGGKDSLACLLHLLDLGVPTSRIELWHHEVDGREGSKLMDWPCTRSYCEKLAKAFGVPIYFSWKMGGFEGEMDRRDSPTRQTAFEVPGGEVRRVGGRGPAGTRGKYPQVTADLTVRWCSPYLKIDVARRALANQERFNHSRTLFVTGERAQESANRAKYLEFEPHPADARDGKKGRLIDWWRPVHSWTEAEVWECIERHNIRPHPAYFLGWGRVSCAGCIFGSPNQWASLKAVNPTQFEVLADREAISGQNVQRKLSLRELAAKGQPYPSITTEHVVDALGIEYLKSIRMAAGTWTLPAGAFADSAGPT